jgi:hypothetical protein
MTYMRQVIAIIFSTLLLFAFSSRSFDGSRNIINTGNTINPPTQVFDGGDDNPPPPILNP